MSNFGILEDNRDGKKYKTLKIGNQEWMVENLRYDVGEGSCSYKHSDENEKEFGRLYNWQAAKKAVLDIDGWQLPSKKDWEVLLDFIKGEDINAYSNMIIGGTSGFNAPFGGFRALSGDFYGKGSSCGFWSSTEGENESAWGCYLDKEDKLAGMSDLHVNYGRYIRLIKS